MSSDAHYFHPAAAVAFSAQKMKKLNLFESPRMFCDVYGLEPGQEQPEHAHEGSDKVYLVLSGTPTVRIGTESRQLAAGRLAVAPSGVRHAVQNTGPERAVLLVVMAPHPAFKG
jgi:mannose-6-phosphate isomerase-like protein (cupin superfamily)